MRDRAGREEDAPVVDRLVQTEQYEVKVFEHAALLDLVPEEHVHRVRERDERGVQHELVLGRVADDVEDEVERVLVDRQVRVVQDDVACVPCAHMATLRSTRIK